MRAVARVVHSSGQEQFYEVFYEGEQGTEHIVRMVSSCGKEFFFEGERDTEHIVRIVLASGEEHFFEGETGAECMV